MTALSELEQRQMWRSIANAVGGELQDATSIKGASGLEHPVQAVAIDEKLKRIIVISAESNARISVLMQGDVQSIMPEYKILVARPAIIDLRDAARRLLNNISPIIPVAKIEAFNNRWKNMSKEEHQAELKNHISSALSPIMKNFNSRLIPTTTQLLNFADQISQVDWKLIINNMKLAEDAKEFDMTPLFEIDTTKIDRQYGICPIPLFEFSDSDWDIMLKPNSTEELRDRLSQLDILQYFYPAPDQIALGLIDKNIRNESEIIEIVRRTPDLGHPLSNPEIVPSLSHFSDVVDALKENGHAVEGEYGLEITETGSTIRTTVKIRPKEGIVTKILNRLNINLSASPKDFITH